MVVGEAVRYDTLLAMIRGRYIAIDIYMHPVVSKKL